MRENDLYRALDASVTGCQPSDYWKNRMVRQIGAKFSVLSVAS